MKKLIIHIGYSKSGSTNIQKYLKDNYKNLLERYGIYYPPEDNEGLECSYEFFSTAHNCEKSSLVSLVRSYFEKADTVLLSSEYIASLYEKISVLNEVADQIKIVAYVRRQDAWLSSAYQQWVKLGHDKALNCPAKGISTKPKDFLNSFNIESIDWYTNLSFWASYFGKENVKARVFDKTLFVDGDLVADFFDLISLDKPKDFFVPADSSNESLSPLEVEVLRRCNELSDSSSFLSNVNFLKSLDIKKSNVKFSVFENSKARNSFLERFQVNNSRLVSEFCDYQETDKVLSVFLYGSDILDADDVENDLINLLLVSLRKQYLINTSLGNRIKKIEQSLGI